MSPRTRRRISNALAVVTLATVAFSAVAACVQGA